MTLFKYSIDFFSPPFFCQIPSDCLFILPTGLGICGSAGANLEHARMFCRSSSLLYFPMRTQNSQSSLYLTPLWSIEGHICLIFSFMSMHISLSINIVLRGFSRYQRERNIEQHCFNLVRSFCVCSGLIHLAQQRQTTSSDFHFQHQCQASHSGLLLLYQCNHEIS